MSEGNTMQVLASRARSRTELARLINRAWATVPPAIATISPATYSYLTSLSLAIAMYSAYVARAISTIGTSVARGASAAFELTRVGKQRARPVGPLVALHVRALEFFPRVAHAERRRRIDLDECVVANAQRAQACERGIGMHHAGGAAEHGDRGFERAR